MSTIPREMQALVVTSNGNAEIKSVPVPQPSSTQILIKIAYAASNPVDCSQLGALSSPGSILGCDYAGTVVAVGDAVKSVSVGDRVGLFVHGGTYPDRGSYAQYAVADSEMVMNVGDMDFKEAATFGVGFNTAALCLFHHHKNKYPPAQRKGEWFLIQGGSTSVGLFTIQLAKIIGYKVIATCSSHSNDLVKSYGADAVVDYHNVDEAIKQIKDITGGGVVGGIVTVVSKESLKLSTESFKEGGGLLTALLRPDTESLREDVKVEMILLFMVGGYSFDFIPGQTLPPSPSDHAWFVEWLNICPEIIKKYKIKANPVDERQGLESVLPGLKELGSGKVSGKKLVYRIDH